VLNLHIARTYLTATDPEVAKRTWQVPMDEMTKTKTGSTRVRHEVAMKDKAFDLIRNLPILETHSAHFLKVLELGTVSTNVYLRRIHNFALDMNWLPWSVLPKRQWPKVRFKEKRAITWAEHEKIIAAEVNPERKALYQLCWHLGASQGDIASLKGEDVDWTNSTMSFVRKKTGVPVIVHLGGEALNLFKDLPAEGVLFPYLSSVRAGDRATEFKQRCQRLGIQGVTLHSYRYAWAERAKTVGYPERFAQEALGHNSKAVHRAYAKRALMKIPSLEDYEQRAAAKVQPAT
jgi:integrase